MSRLYFDIETIPSSNPDVIADIRKSIKHPGNISKPETIEKWYAENLESETKKAIHKTGLDGLYGEICSIAWAIEDQPVLSFTRYPEQPESLLLNSFMLAITNIVDQRGQRAGITQWIGHNICGFDIRFLWQRCVINNIMPLVRIPKDAKPWDDIVFDTMVEWAGNSSSYSGRKSISALSPIFGLNKSDTDGSMVADMWEKGQYEKIAEYNRQDVEDVRTLYKRMTFADV